VRGGKTRLSGLRKWAGKQYTWALRRWIGGWKKKPEAAHDGVRQDTTFSPG